MVRLNIIVEGDTEKGFVKRTLAPYLGDFGVYAKARSVGGFGRYMAIKRDVMSWLKEDKGSDCRFTTMFDLYPIRKDIPGLKNAMKEKDKYKRVDVLEKAIAQDLNDPRFIPYIQLHEFEAIILADPNSLSCQFDGYEKAIQNLIDMVEKEGGNPELINDKYDTCPSRRIISEISEYKDDKALYGVTVADKIGIQAMRDKCKHFNDWLRKLEGLDR
ncbi:MAG: DUF4276 family protein [Nitrospirae bacterium]|nr:DUF4276 family protein [Nitrospirota bacterium]